MTDLKAYSKCSLMLWQPKLPEETLLYRLCDIAHLFFQTIEFEDRYYVHLTEANVGVNDIDTAELLCLILFFKQEIVTSYCAHQILECYEAQCLIWPSSTFKGGVFGIWWSLFSHYVTFVDLKNKQKKQAEC